MPSLPDFPHLPAFRQLPFDQLPDQPRRPHPFFNSRLKTWQVASDIFGTHCIRGRMVGNGPPLLLLHGLMTTSYSWRYIIPSLATSFTLYMPDLPGAGLSDKPNHAPYSPDNLAQWIIDFQHAAGIHGCACVGNSMAGYLAMRSVLIESACFSHLINVHSPGLPMARFHLLSWALSMPGAHAILHRLIQRDPLRWAHRHVHYHDESLKSLEEAREYAAPLMTPEGSYAFFKYLRETFAPQALHDFSQQLQRRLDQGRPFPIPLTLVYARQDPMVPPWVGEKLAALLPQSRFVWLNDASHFAQVDVPDTLAAVIRQLIFAPHSPQ